MLYHEKKLKRVDLTEKPVEDPNDKTKYNSCLQAPPRIMITADTDIDSMEPIDEKIDILGGSSDHIILDVTKSDKEYKVGYVVAFTLGYGGMLKTATSAYVEKAYVK